VVGLCLNRPDRIRPRLIPSSRAQGCRGRCRQRGRTTGGVSATGGAALPPAGLVPPWVLAPKAGGRKRMRGRGQPIKWKKWALIHIRTLLGTVGVE
jgi:hypothetical protein